MKNILTLCTIVSCSLALAATANVSAQTSSASATSATVTMNAQNGSGETGTDDNDGVFALVRGVDQLDVETGLVPCLIDGAGRCFGVKNHLFHQPQ